MATYTDNYNLAKPEGSDYYNHQLYDNNNMNIIDEALKAVSNNTITTATDTYNEGVHSLIREDNSCKLMWFYADDAWTDTNTLTIDGSEVIVRTVAGKTPENNAFITGSRVIGLLDDGIFTIFVNIGESEEITDAIESIQTAITTLESKFSEDVGSSTKHIYLSDGEFISSSETVGSATQPIYLNEGVLTPANESTNYSIISGGSTPSEINARMSGDETLSYTLTENKPVRLVITMTGELASDSSSYDLIIYNNGVPIHQRTINSNNASDAVAYDAGIFNLTAGSISIPTLTNVPTEYFTDLSASVLIYEYN